MSDEEQLVPIPDPLDLDAAPFTPAYRRNLVKWAVNTTREAVNPDAPREQRVLYPFAVYVLQFETALRVAEDEVARLGKAIDGETSAYESGFRAGMGAAS